MSMSIKKDPLVLAELRRAARAAAHYYAEMIDERSDEYERRYAERYEQELARLTAEIDDAGNVTYQGAPTNVYDEIVSRRGWVNGG